MVNTNIAIAAAIGFLNCLDDENINKFPPTRGWAQSLFRRMKFVKRFATTGKVEIPEGVKKEAELLFIHDIFDHIEKNKIPQTMVLNVDQTPLKYVSCGKMTMAEKNSKRVPMKGVSDKRMVTETFTISWSGNFLQIQLIYAGKTKRSFSLSANPTRLSNETESLKLLEDIIPYFKKERERLGLSVDHKGLVIMDVFKGQTTTAVQGLLKKNNILFTKVPANMTYVYQPLDPTVNGYAKSFMTRHFSDF